MQKRKRDIVWDDKKSTGGLHSIVLEMLQKGVGMSVFLCMYSVVSAVIPQYHMALILWVNFISYITLTQ